MAYPAYLRDRARELRVEKRLTLDEIVDRLALPRTTIYEWIKDLPLDKPRSTAGVPVGQPLATKAMQAKYQRLREEAYAQGAAEFAALDVQATFRDFVVLYIAEGYKRNRNVVSICNSDPTVMRLACHWLRELSERPLTYGLQHHADQDLEELRQFWGGTLEFDGTRLKLQRKSNSNQLARRTWRSEHGVLTITVGDTLLRARLQAWIDIVKSGWQS